MSIATFIIRQLEVHETARQHVDTGDAQLQFELERIDAGRFVGEKEKEVRFDGRDGEAL